MRTLHILTIACCLLASQLAAEEPAPTVPRELRARADEANRLFTTGDFAGAEKVYQEMVDATPGNVYLLSNLGVTLFRQGKYKVSEAVFLEAAKLAPNDAFTRCTLGIVYYMQARYDDAVVSLKRALEINPNDAAAHNYLGMTLSQQGHEAEGLKELETAVKLDPAYADAIFNLAVALATWNPSKKAEARKYYQRALDLGVEHDAALDQIFKDGHGQDARPPLKGTAPKASRD
jgi:Flp pilus assembly protein TadD